MTGDGKRVSRGKADWLYDAEFDLHIPCCSQPKGRWRCWNGPLVGDAIATGDCGESHEVAPPLVGKIGEGELRIPRG